MNIRLSIMTPEQVFWNQPVEKIILLTNSGKMGVLYDHADLITAIKIGVMGIRSNESWQNIALENGFATVHNDLISKIY